MLRGTFDGVESIPESTQLPNNLLFSQMSHKIPQQRQDLRRRREQRVNPTRALSNDLINTYSEINAKYYSQQAKKKQKLEYNYSTYNETVPVGQFGLQLPAQSAMNSSNYFEQSNVPYCEPYNTFGQGETEPVSDGKEQYLVHKGALLGGKYIVQHKIGSGSFGQVVSALDRFTNRSVAVKVIKSGKPFLLQSKTEIALLQELNENDRFDEFGIVSLLDTFIHDNHQCLVFEKLSCNLYQLLRKTNMGGLSLPLIRKIGSQILVALCYLKRLNIIHCDLKPENILLREQNRDTIKIIDFGSSCRTNKTMYSYIQSRYYRAPEVLLGQPYCPQIDVWSLGCILLELHTGKPLFPGKDEYEQMLRIVCMNGIPPNHLFPLSKKASNYFSFDEFSGNWKFKLNQQNSTDISMFPKTIEEILGLHEPNNTSKVFHRRVGSKDHSTQDYLQFVDLLKRLLVYDSYSRLTPSAALQHSFFSCNPTPKGKQEHPNYFSQNSFRRSGSAPNLNLLIN